MNAFKPEELDECFERNSEGMLKNMMIHEIALMCTYNGVAVDTIAEACPSSCLYLYRDTIAAIR
jgi:hypothetical protein